MKTKSFSQIQELLVEVGFSESLIRKTLADLLTEGEAHFPISVAANAASKVLLLTEQLDNPSTESTTSYTDWPTLDGTPKPITKNWKARVNVITALCSFTGKSRIDISYLRLEFIEKMQAENKFSRHWNIEFVKFILNKFFYLIQQHTSPHQKAPESSNSTQEHPIDVSDLLKQFRPSYLNISKFWKPNLHTQKVLYHRGVPFDVTNHPAMVNGFINNVASGHIPGDQLQSRYVHYIEAQREHMEEIELSSNNK